MIQKLANHYQINSKEIKNKLECFLFIFIAFSFVFKISIATPAILLLLLLNLKLDNLKNTNYYTKCVFISLIFCYSLFFISFITASENSRFIIKTSAFVFISMLFLFKKINQKSLFYFAISFLIAQLICLIQTDFMMLKALFLDHKNDFNELTKIIEDKLILSRPYLALNCLLAMICSKFIFDKKKINFLALNIILLFIIISLVLIAARLALGVSILLYLIIILRNIKAKKYIYLSATLMFIIFGAFFFGNYAKERILLKQGEPRIAIWQCAYDIYKQNDFNIYIGDFNSEKIDLKLIECYNSKKIAAGPYWWIGKNSYNYNTHNQFIWFFMSYGLIGLFSYLIIFAMQLNVFFKTKSIYPLLFVLVFSSQSFFENILERQLGIYLFVWFGFIFLNIKNSNEK